MSEHSFDHLNRLTRFDLSKVILNQLYSTSKCILARHLRKLKQTNPTMIIYPPQAEFCDCVYDFILNLLNEKPTDSYKDLCRNIQQERCQLSECDIVKNSRLAIKEHRINVPFVPSIHENINDVPISLFPVNDRTATIQSSLPATTVQRQPFDTSQHPPIVHRFQKHNYIYNSSVSSFADTQVIII